jgi:hypothetical protein
MPAGFNIKGKNRRGREVSWRIFSPQNPPKFIMDQHEFVRGAYAYYAENGYEPGNPEDGVWHDCHYPEPECLGGKQTIKLLREHHVIQGILQSEEYQWCCIFSWEIEYLPEEYHHLFYKWRRQIGSYAGTRSAEVLSPDERSKKAKKAGDARAKTITPVQLEQLQKSVDIWRKENPEVVAANAARARSFLDSEFLSNKAKTEWETLTDEDKLARCSKISEGMLTRSTPEERSNRAKEGKKKQLMIHGPSRVKPLEVVFPDGKVKTFSSMKECSKVLNVSYGLISKVLGGGKVRKLAGFIITEVRGL